MALDALIINPGRLRILTALATRRSQEFVQLRGATNLTDGNLATHARRLASAGLLAIDKSFRDGKPVTTFTLTQRGQGALMAHVESLMRAVRIRPGPADTLQEQPAAAVVVPSHRPSTSEGDWID
jgi:DNA-binding MarR family transcriptional regulator